MPDSLKHGIRAAANAVVGAFALALFAILGVPASRAIRAWRIRRALPPRMMWGPIPIVNVRYTSLASRAAGFPSESVVDGVYSINRRDDYDRVCDRLARIPLLRELTPYAVFVGAAFRYDAFGFFFDGGLLWATPFWRAELALLALARKIVLVYPYGSDARLASETRRRGGWHAYSDVPVGEEDRDEQDVRRRIASFARYADVMLGCADLFEDLPRLDGIMRYAFDSTGWEPTGARADEIVRIVHAPNHRHYKGTRFLVDAVEQLQNEGLPLELVLIEGMPTDEARARYASADIVADQFLIGAYALFAIEGMALGKPVICYLNDRFRVAHPEWAECPILSADPDGLVDVLRDLVLNADRRLAAGARGPEYVRKYHSLAAVGADIYGWVDGQWR